MDWIRATVRIHSVPRPHEGDYDAKEWSRVPLFSCLLRTGSDYESNDGKQLKIQLETFAGELIAIAPYNGESGVVPAENSTTQFVIIVENNDGLRAVLGVAFADRTDSIDFSMILQDFTRRRHDAERIATTGWSKRMLGRRKESKWSHNTEDSDSSDSSDDDNDNDNNSNDASAANSGKSHVPALAPPPLDNYRGYHGTVLDSGSDDDFGDFQ